MRTTPLALLLAGAVATGAALIPTAAFGGAGAARAARGHTVILQREAFHPGTLTISRGDSVTWVWRDGGIVHNVIARSFRSRTMTYGSFTERFIHSGTFDYRCTIHPHMTGAIIVH